MKLPRRHFLRLAAGASALAAISRFAWGQSYPSRPVRIIVGFAAGGPNDIARASDRSVVVAAPRAAIRHREPAGRGQQYRNRGRRARASGRLYALAGRFAERDQCHALRQSKFQFHPRHRTGREPDSWCSCHVGTSLGSGQDASRVHCLRQGESGQALVRFGRRRRDHPSDPRAVQAGGGRPRHSARAVSRRGARAYRSARCPGAGRLYQPGTS